MHRNGIYLLALIAATALTLFFAYYLWRATYLHEGDLGHSIFGTGMGIMGTVKIIQAMMKPRPTE